MNEPAAKVDDPRNRAGAEEREEPARKRNALEYFYLALYAFALVGLELVLLALEPVLDLPSESVLAQIVHWVLTIFWVCGAIGLVVLASRRTTFRLRSDAEPRVGVVRWLSIAVLVVVTLVAQWLLQGGAFPPLVEHATLSERFGDVTIQVSGWLSGRL